MDCGRKAATPNWYGQAFDFLLFLLTTIADFRHILRTGLETPYLFQRTNTITPETEELINRLLAILIISTSSNPLSILSSFHSLADLYPAPEFIPSTPGWFDNDFSTQVQAVKDPRVLTTFLRRVTSQSIAVVDTDVEDQGSRVEQDVQRMAIPLPHWYTTFVHSDQSSSYPSDAYTNLLGPLISKQQQSALSSIFDTWLYIDDSSRFNSTSALFLAQLMGWWILSYPSRLSKLVAEDNGGEGLMRWRTFYDTWVEAGEAVYRLFLSWIRYASFHAVDLSSSSPRAAVTHRISPYPAMCSASKLWSCG